MATAQLEEAFHAHGHDALAVAALDRGTEWFAMGPERGVAFARFGRARIGITSPLAAPEEWLAVAEAFVDDARSVGERAFFFGVERPELFGPRFRSILIGQQPVWDPAAWEGVLATTPRLRDQVRRAERKSVIVRRVEPAELSGDTERRAQWSALVDGWLETRRMAPMQFVVRPRGLRAPDEREFFLAERGDELVGFLCTSRLPRRNAVAIGDVFRHRSAPNGTVEALHDRALRRSAELEVGTVLAGLVPLAGPVHPSLRVARALGRPLFDFRGLQTFRSRLRPRHWDPVYLSIPSGVSPVSAVRILLRAFAGGSFLRFGVQTIGHRIRRRRQT